MALNAENCKTWWSVIISCQVLSNPPERLTKKLELATKIHKEERTRIVEWLEEKNESFFCYDPG